MTAGPLGRTRTPTLLWPLAALLALAGCRGVEVSETPRVQRQLVPQLTGLEAPLGPQDDYWTETLGSYLTPGELQSYWLLPADQRFQRYGARWLEFALREDLLRKHRADLSPEEIDRFRSQPDYDSSRKALQAMLAKDAAQADGGKKRE